MLKNVHIKKAWKKVASDFDHNFLASTTSRCEKEDQQSASLICPLLKTFGPSALVAIGWKVVSDGMTLLAPQIIKMMISFVEENEEQMDVRLFSPLF